MWSVFQFLERMYFSLSLWCFTIPGSYFKSGFFSASFPEIFYYDPYTTQQCVFSQASKNILMHIVHGQTLKNSYTIAEEWHRGE